MNMGVKRLLLAISLIAVLPLVFTGCQKKGAYPTCKSDGDCRVDATGKEINGVCYMGKCEECAQDSDCSDLKQCVNNKCHSACQADADCGSNERCENKFCVALGSGDSGAGLAQGACGNLKNIYFDFDRYNVKEEYREEISSFASCMQANPASTALIEGHTDDRGTPSYNMALSERRATAVKEYLQSNWGIDASRLKTVAYGETKPAVNERNEDAWKQNRRAICTLENN